MPSVPKELHVLVTFITVQQIHTLLTSNRTICSPSLTIFPFTISTTPFLLNLPTTPLLLNLSTLFPLNLSFTPFPLNRSTPDHPKATHQLSDQTRNIHNMTLTPAPASDDPESRPTASPDKQFQLESKASDVPTAPPSPKVSPSASQAQSTSQSVIMRKIHGVRSLGVARCGICLRSLQIFDAKGRVRHLNRCWWERVEAAREAKQKDDESEAKSTSLSIGFWALIEDDPRPKKAAGNLLPPDSCINCQKDVSHMDTVAAFGHRLDCTTRMPPIFCSVCNLSFMGLRRWRSEDILGHVLKCQGQSDLPGVDAAEFDGLAKAWQGRKEMVIAATKPKKGMKHARDRVKAFKNRRNRGRLIGRGIHPAESSPLRASSVCKEEGIEVVVVENVMRRAGLDRLRNFRTHQYAVLRPGAGRHLTDDYRAEMTFTKTKPYPMVAVPLKLAGPSTEGKEATGALSMILSTFIPNAKKTSPKNKKKKSLIKKVGESSGVSQPTPRLFLDKPHTITDLVSALCQPKPDTKPSKDPQPNIFNRAHSAHARKPPTPGPPKNPNALLARLKRPHIPAGKIIKTVDFTLGEEHMPLVSLQRTVTQFPETSFTCPEELVHVQQTANIMNGSPRYYPELLANPGVNVTRPGVYMDGSEDGVAHSVRLADRRFVVFGGGNGVNVSGVGNGLAGEAPAVSMPTFPRRPTPPQAGLIPEQQYIFPAPTPARPHLNFLCADETDEPAGHETFDDPVRGVLPLQLRSSIPIDRTGDVDPEEIARRAREACVFGGVDEMGG